VSLRIDDEGTTLDLAVSADRRVAEIRRAPECDADASGENFRAEGFDDIIVGPELKPRYDIRVLAAGRRHDDGDPRGLVIGLDPTQYLESVDTRQHDIEDDAVRLACPDEAQPPLAILRLENGPALALERGEEELPDFGIVLDDENYRLRHGGA
jgi:hypothetical protein